MGRTLTVFRKSSAIGMMRKYYIQINGATLAKIGNGETVTLTIPTEPSNLKIVIPPPLDSPSAIIPGGYGDINVQLIWKLGLIKNHLDIEMTSKPAPEPRVERPEPISIPGTGQPSIHEQANQHNRRVLDLAGQYLETFSDAAIRELEEMYDTTDAFYKLNFVGYEGTQAIHAHALALRYVNEAYDPERARSYAHTAEKRYAEYMEAIPAQEREKARIYQIQVWTICAYLDYVNDDLHSAHEWLQKVPFKEYSLPETALLATLLFRFAYEEGKTGLFQKALDLFQLMDANFKGPQRFSFVEDILRAAYGFYEMFYTDPNVNGQVSADYDPNKAVLLLTRASSLMQSPQQKAWIQEDIEKAKAKALAAREGQAPV